jgi:hypothetical protein
LPWLQFPASPQNFVGIFVVSFVKTREQLHRQHQPPPPLQSLLALWSTLRFSRIFKAVQSNSNQTFPPEKPLFTLHFATAHPSFVPLVSFCEIPSLPKSKIKNQKYTKIGVGAFSGQFHPRRVRIFFAPFLHRFCAIWPITRRRTASLHDSVSHSSPSHDTAPVATRQSLS